MGRLVRHSFSDGRSPLCVRFPSSFLCFLCLFAAIPVLRLSFASLRLCVRFFLVFLFAFIRVHSRAFAVNHSPITSHRSPLTLSTCPPARLLSRPRSTLFAAC